MAKGRVTSAIGGLLVGIWLAKIFRKKEVVSSGCQEGQVTVGSQFFCQVPNENLLQSQQICRNGDLVFEQFNVCPETFQVIIRVRTQNDLNPIVGANVEIVGVAINLTNNNGFALFDAVPGGVYNLRMSAVGYHPLTVIGFEISNDLNPSFVLAPLV